MYSIYRWLYSQFAFSRGQSNALIILLPLSLVFALSEPIWRFISAAEQRDSAQENVFLDSAVAVLFEPPPVRPIERVPFDPNEASADELISVGFTPPVARRITAYIEKGGRFRTPDDLYRIYGSDSAFLADIVPWVRIDPSNTVAHVRIREPQTPDKRVQKSEPFDLNLADTTQLKSVRGIGSKLALRIVRYRESLGGYYSKNQLFDVFRLDSAVVHELGKNCFIASDFIPKQIPINAADAPELADHPYITGREAAAIVAYRFTHGKFASVEDLARIEGLDSVRLVRIFPYVKID